MKNSETLSRARALIDAPEKWVKGSFSRIEGITRCYCAVGAISLMADSDYDLDECEIALAKHIPSDFKIASGYREVVYFNDHPITRHADVMELFDRAIAAEEASEAEEALLCRN